MPDYQTNSKKSKEKEEAEQNVEPIVTGPVIQKPKGNWVKFKGIFFGGDFKQSANHVIGDVFWPALRQLAFDIVVEGAKGAFFGESGYRRRGPTEYGSRIQYNTPMQLPRRDVRSPGYLHPGVRLPDQPPYQRPMPSYRREFDQIILYSREEAENVLERLTDAIDKYDEVSIANLYRLLGLETQHVDNKWGWRYLHNTEIRQTKDGFLLDLPPVEVL